MEPALPLAECLKRNYRHDVDSERLQIHTQLFETLEPAGFAPFPQIWSSDAWHWVNPAAGYRLAAALLAPDDQLRERGLDVRAGSGAGGRGSTTQVR